MTIGDVPSYSTRLGTEATPSSPYRLSIALSSSGIISGLISFLRNSISSAALLIYVLILSVTGTPIPIRYSATGASFIRSNVLAQ